LDASVTAQCWRPFGQPQQICCETIAIRTTRAGAEDLAPVLRALLAVDLPVVVWVHGRELLDAAEFGPVFDLAGKLIVNSSVWRIPNHPRADPGVGGARRAVADLS
jgi:glucose-6-phosphate dehydrogenase assembly protein OpcA